MQETREGKSKGAGQTVRFTQGPRRCASYDSEIWMQEQKERKGKIYARQTDGHAMGWPDSCTAVVCK
jgi:hypothetical protein